jgi:prolyl-tRNA editing enzyme YbaK/EbsC (Cys-tRNA(Pro) deacylase)
MVSFEEFATPASAPKSKKQPQPSADGYIYDPATAELHVQALEYAEEKGVDYTIALKAILSNS